MSHFFKRAKNVSKEKCIKQSWNEGSVGISYTLVLGMSKTFYCFQKLWAKSEWAQAYFRAQNSSGFGQKIEQKLFFLAKLNWLNLKMTSDRSYNVRTLMFDPSESKIGCSISITKWWTVWVGSMFEKIMFESVWWVI